MILPFRLKLIFTLILITSLAYSQTSFDDIFTLKNEKISPTPNWHYELFVHDLNGNGKFEIITYENGFNCYEIGSNGFEKTELPVLQNYKLDEIDNNCFLDWDNDGDIDIVALEETTYPNTIVMLFENDGKGSFKKSIINDRVTLPDHTYKINTCDFDFNGMADLFVYGNSNNEYGSVLLYLNRQNDFDLTVDTLKIEEFSYPDLISDMNNDRVADFIGGKGYFDGGNNFGFVNWCFTGNSFYPSGIYRDLNNDGIYDYINKYYKYLSNKETGCYTQFDSELAYDKMWACDWNNDGYTDLISNHDWTMYFYENDKSGGFTEKFTGYFVYGYDGIVTADIDQDGDMDLILGNNLLSFYENTNEHNRGINLKLTRSNLNYSFYNLEAKVFSGQSVQVKKYKIDYAIESGQSVHFHFGLGTVNEIDSIQVTWPSGLIQTQKNIPYSANIEIIENTDSQTQAVTSLAGNVLYPDKALLKWDEEMYGEERFIVQRKTAHNNEFVSIDTIPANSVQYFDNTYLAGQTVYYRLISDSKLGSAQSNELKLVYGDPLPLPATTPTLKIDSLSYDLVALEWDKIKDANQYIIQRKKNGENSFGVIAKTDSTAHRHLDYSVKENSSYTYRVIASNHGSHSSPSDEINASVPYSLFKLTERVNLEPHRLWRIMDYNGDGDKDLYYMLSDLNNEDITASYVFENIDGTHFKDSPTKIGNYLPHVYHSYAMPFYDFNKDNLPEIYSSDDTITSFDSSGNYMFFKDSLEIEHKRLLAWAGYLNDDLNLDYIYRDYGSYPTANVYVKLSDVQRKGGDLLVNSMTYSDCFVVKDWNADGLNDILVARNYNRYLTITHLINNNHDIQRSQININNSSEYTSIDDVTRLEDCDFNNDGFFDLFIQREDNGYILTNRNNKEFTISHEFKNLRFAQIKDFDNDGYADIIGYNISKRAIESYINNKNGGFTSTHYDFFDNSKYPQWIQSTDMDGDGDIEMVIGVKGNEVFAEGGSRTREVNEIWIYSNKIIEIDNVKKEKLQAPTHLEVNVTGSQASFSWDKITNHNNIKYNIYLKNEQGEFLISSVTSTDNGADYSCSGNYWSNSNFFNTTCLDNGTYYWAVQTIDTDGRTSPFSKESSFSITQPALTKPEGFKVDVLSPTEINMYWSTEDANVEYFEVQRKKEGDQEFETIALKRINETFCYESELAPNSSYTYRVRAYNCTTESEFTESVTAQTPPYIYTLSKKFPVIISNSSRPELADLDNNGLADFICQNNNRLEIYYGVNDTVSSPTYLDLTPFSNYYYSNTNFQLVDYDKNGYLDIIITSQSSVDSLIINGFMNTGSDFKTMQLDTIHSSRNSNVKINDIDNDGDWDYYGNISTDGWNTMATIIMNPNEEDSVITFEGTFPECKHLVDLNKDGYKDIPMIIGDRYNNTDEVVTVSLSANEQWQTKELHNDVWSSTNTLFIEYSDWNNDGWMDILSYSYSDEDKYRFCVLENNDGVSFNMIIPYTDVSLEYEPYLNITDINGDNITDAVFSGRRSGIYEQGKWAMLNDNNNNFLSAQGPGLISHNYISYTSHYDIDADGDPELIVYNDDTYRGNAGIEIFKNNYYPFYTDEWKKPMSPVNLKREAYGKSGSILSWENNSNEAHESYYYNVQILNQNGDTIVSAESLGSGERLIQNYGNCGINKFFKAHALPVGTYTWKVQAINKAMNASVFSGEATFNQEVKSGIDDFSVQPIISYNRNNKTITLANQYLPSRIKIYDVQGRILFDRTIYDNQLELSSLSINTNLIIVEVSSNNKVCHQKILL